ncbi:hypothetical protein DTO166G4_374 [Paecilomyces variotii]|nr:hypothetical protein DTO166G4_374 [Paecilomyces variotii]KAJ9237243.1 hypothetical protein DTO166G5_3639 [Paecilomyces variotii]
MIVNKKLDRFKQWAGEKMGGEAKTNLSDDFKALETEMAVRQEGLERMHKAMTVYIKAISKRSEGDDKERNLPIGYMGGSMVAHGGDFDMYSEFGQCLSLFGRTQERIARIEESYIAQATSTWLESLERSLTQMKEYHNARKKLDTRRLAYDASLAKMQKAKKEDFRVEEELRTQKVKYEEASDDVYRRMLDIKESEPESVADLSAFMDAELEYHERCREALLQLRNDWPAGQGRAPNPGGRRPGRPRANTAHSYQERYEPVEEEPVLQTHRPSLRSMGTPSSNSVMESPNDSYSTDYAYQRPVYSSTPSFEGPTQLQGDQSPARMSRVINDNTAIRSTRSSLRPVSKAYVDPYADSADEAGSYSTTSPLSTSPAASHGSVMSRNPSSTTLNGAGIIKKGPPPPPPSRAKKPPPPPPPMKRNLVGAGAY